MKKNQHVYLESGMTIDLNGYSYFRFETCEGYKKELCCHGIKEIDFGWWSDDEQCLILLELKDYSLPACHLQKKDKSEKLIENLWKKSIDVVFMLSSIWLNNIGSHVLKKEIPPQAHQKCKVKIYHLIKCNNKLKMHLDPINIKLKAKFKGYKHLYSDCIVSFNIISNDQGEKKFGGIIKTL